MARHTWQKAFFSDSPLTSFQVVPFRMHRCLELPDIVELVCSHLEVPSNELEPFFDGQLPEHRDLAALARTSTVLSTHAVRLLWKSVNISNLFRCLPSDSFSLRTTGRSLRIQYIMVGGIVAMGVSALKTDSIGTTSPFTGIRLGARPCLCSTCQTSHLQFC